MSKSETVKKSPESPTEMEILLRRQLRRRVRELRSELEQMFDDTLAATIAEDDELGRIREAARILEIRLEDEAAPAHPDDASGTAPAGA